MSQICCKRQSYSDSSEQPGMLHLQSVCVCFTLYKEWPINWLNILIFSKISECISHSWALCPETWDIYPCFLENMPKILGMIFELNCYFSFVTMWENSGSLCRSYIQNKTFCYAILNNDF